MKNNLIIIGAGGYAREIADLSVRSRGYGDTFILKGFLDRTVPSHPEKSLRGYPPIIASIESYEPKKEDVFVCAIGDITVRKKRTEEILLKGGKFISLIARSAIISPSSEIGEGVVIHDGTLISSCCKVNDHAHFQFYCAMGHDATIGEFSFCHSFVHIGGEVQIGCCVHIYPHAIICPRIDIHDGATIGAGAFCLRSVPAAKTVFVDPARILQ